MRYDINNQIESHYNIFIKIILIEILSYKYDNI